MKKKKLNLLGERQKTSEILTNQKAAKSEDIFQTDFLRANFKISKAI